MIASVKIGGEGVAFGLSEQVSPMTLIPDCIHDGQRVNAFVLMRIDTDYSPESARALDAATYPCPMCGLAFCSREGWGICEVCELGEAEVDGLVTIHDHEIRLELAGSYTPRCDF
jgi:hypothetical protein